LPTDGVEDGGSEHPDALKDPLFWPLEPVAIPAKAIAPSILKPATSSSGSCAMPLNTVVVSVWELAESERHATTAANIQWGVFSSGDRRGSTTTGGGGGGGEVSESRDGSPAEEPDLQDLMAHKLIRAVGEDEAADNPDFC
jgi:hypothetical protein